MTISSRRGGAAAEFRAAPAERVVAAGGAVGIMPQSGTVAISTAPSGANLSNLGGYGIRLPDGAGVTLSGGCQLAPGQSTGTLNTHHPEARYFSA